MHSNSYSELIKSILPEIASKSANWAYEAGQIALKYFNRTMIRRKSDNSLFTQADIEIEQFLMNEIRTAYPSHSILSEESGGSRVESKYIWAIDPLDGTTSYIKGLPGWGISIGLLYIGQPVFGLFYMPLLNDMTYTTVDSIYCTNSVLCKPLQRNWEEQGFLAVNAGACHDFYIDVLRTRALGSVSASLIYTARGSATATLIPKAYLWDLAAGAHVLNAVGGEVRYLSGQPVDYRQLAHGNLIPEPIIAGHPDLLIQLQGAIRLRAR